jgi:activator of 2-hydroxyglutaryl-CoA dehydratase
MIEKFEMNDKCAAGTGRFFEVLTERLLNIFSG